MIERNERPSPELIEAVSDARVEFIEIVYPKLFGEEEMGDTSRDFSPAEITEILCLHEEYLASKGLLRAITDKEE
jgi:hypothetical protein